MATLFDFATVACFLAMPGAFFFLTARQPRTLLHLLLAGIAFDVANQLGNAGYVLFSFTLIIFDIGYSVEASSWDELHKRYEVKRINHEEAYSKDGACTNWAEEFFSRMRRAEIGHHHHISGAYLLRYAQEAS